jgi:pimeloyl-ACP methyl ester carboxylesterase
MWRYAPLGKFADIGGYRLHYTALGQGGPAVVLEAAVMDFSLTWALVQPKVAEFTRVVSYDRAGLGWSEPSLRPRNGAVMIDELDALLQAARIDGPFILVGQSFSALLARLYAASRPADVAGIVLLDPAHEDQFARFPAPIREMFGPLKEMQLQQLRSVRDLVALQGPDAAPRLVAAPALMDAETAHVYGFMATADATRLDTAIAELDHLEQTQEQVRSARRSLLGDLPLTVLSHGVPQNVPGMPDDVNQAYEEIWQAMQVEIANLSSRGQRLVVENSGHMIHHDQPQAVVDAIRAMVMSVRGE